MIAWKPDLVEGYLQPIRERRSRIQAVLSHPDLDSDGTVLCREQFDEIERFLRASGEIDGPSSPGLTDVPNFAAGDGKLVRLLRVSLWRGYFLYDLRAHRAVGLWSHHGPLT